MMKLDEQSMEELLRAAGRSAPAAPELPPDLADRVRAGYRRKRRNRMVIAGSLAVVLVVTATVSIRSVSERSVQTPVAPIAKESTPSMPSTPSPKPKELQAKLARLKAEVAQLHSEARQQRKAIERMFWRERLRRQLAGLRDELKKPDPLELARSEIEKTAFLLVDRAQQQSTQAAGNDPAAAYRRTIELFPKTSWAEVARERLNKSPDEQGEP